MLRHCRGAIPEIAAGKMWMESIQRDELTGRPRYGMDERIGMRHIV